jgi:hypothetical protein
MKAFTSFLAVLTLAAPLSSCAPSFDTPPDLQPLLQAYANPTAEVGSQIMSEVADEIAKAAEEIQNSEIFEEILQVIIDVQQELDAATVKTCSGGTSQGSDCDADTDCRPGVCDGGTDEGSDCDADTDCPGGGTCAHPGVCDGGTSEGSVCAADTDCPGGGTCGFGTCVSTGDVVLGQTCEDGANKGNECVDDTDCPDGTCGGGVVVPTPNGQINVNYICPGWDERQFDPDWLKTCDGGANDDSACTGVEDCPGGTCVEAAPPRENGTIKLTMTLDSAGIGRVVWGTADNCLYLVPTDGENFQASYDGGVALDLGDPVSPSEDITKLIVTFLMEGDIGFDGDTYRINQSFRVVLALESALEILVDVGEPALAETFNYFFFFEGLIQGIHDATGVFGCSLEESQCFERICDGGANDGSACTTNADCPEGTCESRERFSW